VQSSDLRSPTDVEVERAAVKSADTSSAPRYVVIVGEKPIMSAPTLTLSKALSRVGVKVRFADANALQRAPWVRLLRSAKAVLLLSYGEVTAYVLSQLATAVAMGVPVVRWWVGTDVLNVITRESLQRNAARVDRIVSTNVAAAPHLVDELSTVGIRAQYVPSVIDADLSGNEVMEWSGATRPVLVYMPESRKEFFGIEVIEPVIAANRDLDFLVVADDSHSLAVYPNVESFGWVSNMQHLYDRAGCILRITAHDGLPRMLIESMVRGAYAIYSWPLAGCWEAHTSEEINKALESYRAASAPNMEGRRAMLQMLRERPDLQMSTVLAEASTPLKQRIVGAKLAVQFKFRGERPA
jgi:hypothetical protein